MSLTLRLTGTGGAQLVPVFGCDWRGLPTRPPRGEPPTPPL
ncbi:beta-lactamase [Klebsiella pneumoniae]|nr:beta-lactamase [Klebsiella pneumoniae]